MGNKYRTEIEFRRNGEHVRTVNTTHTIVNIAVGQELYFDHQTLERGLLGIVTKISHVVFLGDDLPLTYVDVEVKD